MCASFWGWERYDAPAAVEAINDLYRHELRLWVNLYLPSVKPVKKVRMGSKVRRIYDAAQTPFDGALVCAQAKPEQMVELKKVRQSFDPFQLGRLMDQRVPRIYDLADRRLSPKLTPENRGAQAKEKAQGGWRNGCGKAAPWESSKADFSSELAKCAKSAALRTFPQPPRRRSCGYISNGATTEATVTFLNGLTRGSRGVRCANERSKSRIPVKSSQQRQSW